MMKKILVVFFFSIIILFLIYKLINKEEYYYLAIGDEIAKGHNSLDYYSESYVDYYYEYLKEKYKKVVIDKNYIYEDIRIKDLNEYFNNNKEITTLAQAVTKADVITLSIGSEELFSKLRSTFEIKDESTKIIEYIDNMFKELETLIKNIRKLSKNKLFLIGYYNPIRINPENERIIKSIFNYIDKQFIELEEKFNINYIEINNEFINEDYKFVPNINNSFPTKDAQYYIYKQIKKES